MCSLKRIHKIFDTSGIFYEIISRVCSTQKWARNGGGGDHVLVRSLGPVCDFTKTDVPVSSDFTATLCTRVGFSRPRPPPSIIYFSNTNRDAHEWSNRVKHWILGNLKWVGVEDAPATGAMSREVSLGCKPMLSKVVLAKMCSLCVVAIGTCEI